MAFWSIFDRGPLESAWRYPRTITVLGKIVTEPLRELFAELEALQGNLRLEPFGQVHFFRIVVLPESHDLRGNWLPAYLILSAVFDGKENDFLRTCSEACDGPLGTILRHCESFPHDAQSDSVYRWLLRHAHRPQTVHVGTLRDDLPFIREEHALHVAINNFLDDRQAAGGRPDSEAAQIRSDIQKYIRTRSDLPQSARPRIPTRYWLLEMLDVLKVLGLLAAIPATCAILLVWWLSWNWWHLLWLVPAIFLLFTAFYFLVVRCYELVEGDLVVEPHPEHVASLLDDEDFGIQNQISLAIPVRDSRFRRLNLRFVLWVANAVSKHWYRRGNLAGIDTIHFARFSLIDGGRRMLFLSDFDGSWDRYLFDFLDIGSLAVVPIWTNLHGCPKTRFLRFPTKGFAQRFMPFTRANQHHTQVWYSAVDHLTVAEIKRNAEIRAGLFNRRSQAAIEAWLKLF